MAPVAGDFFFFAYLLKKGDGGFKKSSFNTVIKERNVFMVKRINRDSEPLSVV